MDSLSKTLGPERRAWNYWFEDGLPAIVGAFGCLFAGLEFFFASNFRILFFPFYAIILLRHRPITEWIKVRLTYPRTGYVTPPSLTQDAPPAVGDLAALSLQADAAQLVENERDLEERRKRFVALQVLAIFGVLALFAIPSPAMYVVAGVSMAVILWMVRGREVMSSWFVIGGIPVIGVALAILSPEFVTPIQRVGYFVVACSVLMIADGAITLVRYLLRNPVARAQAE